MSWLKGLMDKASTQQQVSVPTLVQRIQDAASREDKKKAIADLKNVSDNTDTSKVCYYDYCLQIRSDSRTGHWICYSRVD